jgi:hypothetical protein
MASGTGFGYASEIRGVEAHDTGFSADRSSSVG